MKDPALASFKYKITSHSQSLCTAEDSHIKKRCQAKDQNQMSKSLC